MDDVLDNIPRSQGSFVVIGAPGSGKTTLAQALARQRGLQYWSASAPMKAKFAFETVLDREAQPAVWREAFSAYCASALREDIRATSKLLAPSGPVVVEGFRNPVDLSHFLKAGDQVILIQSDTEGRDPEPFATGLESCVKQVEFLAALGSVRLTRLFRSGDTYTLEL